MNDHDKDLEDGLPHAETGDEKTERLWQFGALLAWSLAWTVVAWVNRPSTGDFWYDFGLCMTGAAFGVIAILYLIVPLIVRRKLKEDG